MGTDHLCFCHSQAEAEQERRREEARQLAERALRADAEAVAAQVAAAGEIFLFVYEDILGSSEIRGLATCAHEILFIRFHSRSSLELIVITLRCVERQLVRQVAKSRHHRLS